MVIETNSEFESLTYDKISEVWRFNFTNKITFDVFTLWRLLKNKQIIAVSTDHEQKFGHPKPIDLLTEINSKLIGQRLLKIKTKKDIADLILTLTDDLQIEVFISSSGYESYTFNTANEYCVGMGAGNIATWSEK